MRVIIGGVGARFIAPVGWGEGILHVPIYLLMCISKLTSFFAEARYA